jgi:hypothetical protein
LARSVLPVRKLWQIGVCCLGVAASVTLVASPATAAPAVTVTLDSPYWTLYQRALESRGPVDVSRPWDADGAQSPVAVGYGGSVTWDLPDLIDGAPTEAQLNLYPTQDAAESTRAYSSASAVPADQLTMTDLGSGQYRIDLPADDGVNGPIGLLFLKGAESSAGMVAGYGAGGGRDTFGYWLDFSTGGPAAVTLAPQLVIQSQEENVSVRGGDQVDVILPAGSPLTGRGFTNLAAATVTLLAADGDGLPTDNPGIGLTPAVSSDGRTASLTVPTGTPAGQYLLAVVMGAGTDPVVSRTTIPVQVVAAVNPGLRSDTGVADGTPASSSVPIGIGGGLLLAGGAAVAASRLRQQASRS